MDGDELAVLELAADRLESAAIAYMVTGSVALAAYGRPRMTRDVDVVVALTEPEATTIVQLFGGDFFLDDNEIRHAVAAHGMFNLIHSEAVVKLDFIVRKDEPYRREEFRRRRRMELGGRLLWVVAAEDLILSKLAWASDSQSDRQLNDCRTLLESATLDRDYLRHWADELGVAPLLQQADCHE